MTKRVICSRDVEEQLLEKWSIANLPEFSKDIGYNFWNVDIWLNENCTNRWCRTTGTVSKQHAGSVLFENEEDMFLYKLIWLL